MDKAFTELNMRNKILNHENMKIKSKLNSQLAAFATK